MALIGQIRKQSGLLVIIIGVALAAFVLGDFLKPRNKYRANYVGEIAGDEIPIQEFNDKTDEQIQIRKDQQQSDKLSQDDLYQIKQSIWTQMVEKILMGKEYDELGLVVTSDELSDQILGDKPHNFVIQSFRNPQTNAFDPEMVKNFLGNLDNQSPDMKKRYLSLEKMVKEDRLSTKYKNLVTKSYYIPKAFAKLDYDAKNSTANIRFVAAKFTSVSDSAVKVTDADIKAYYEEFKYNYEQEEGRSIDYVVFEVKASAEDRKAITNEVNQLYKDFSTTSDIATFINSVSDNRYDSAYKKEADLPARIAKQVFTDPIGTLIGPYIENETYQIAKIVDKQMRPDSIKMSQILISYETAPSGQGISKRTEQSAKNLVDSLMTVIKKDPYKYQSMAIRFSDYPSAKEDKGEIGWLVDGDQGFSPFFKEGIDAKKGDIKQMTSPLGYHILLISDKTEPIEKARVAMVTRAIEPSNTTYQDFYLKASVFAGENRTLAQFDTAVINRGLNKRAADKLGPMANRIAGVENPRQLVRWAYSEKVKIGDVSPVFEDGKNYIVAALKDTYEKGYSPVEKVKEQIRPLVLSRKKSDYLVEKIKSNSTSDIYRLAQILNEKVDTATNLSFTARNIPGFGREYEVIGEVFSMEAGKVSAPIKGSNAVFVVLVDKINTPAETSNFTSNIAQLKSAFSSKVSSNAVFKALEKKSEIVDNRLLFY